MLHIAVSVSLCDWIKGAHQVDRALRDAVGFLDGADDNTGVIDLPRLCRLTRTEEVHLAAHCALRPPCRTTRYVARIYKGDRRAVGVVLGYPPRRDRQSDDRAGNRARGRDLGRLLQIERQEERVHGAPGIKIVADEVLPLFSYRRRYAAKR